MNDVEHFYAKDRAAWREWLRNNHETKTAVWLVFDKGPGRSMQWNDIVQEALCFGWIDSKPGKVSETQSKIYISKRNPKSAWSKLNKSHVEQLTAQGLLMPAGIAAIELAKQNGAWNLLDRSDNLEIPKEMQIALAAVPTADVNFANFPPGAKRNILQWVYEAKRPETSKKRIAEVVQKAALNIRAR